LSSKRGVLDASVLLTFVWNQPGSERIAALLPDAVIPASALVETLYIAAGQRMTGTIAQLEQRILGTGLKVEPVLGADVGRAAELIALSRRMNLDDGKGLSLGDGLCIAVAERLGLTVISNDDHWLDIELSVRCVSLRTGRFRDPLIIRSPKSEVPPAPVPAPSMDLE
jgi:ribonuclease VapC